MTKKLISIQNFGTKFIKNQFKSRKIFLDVNVNLHKTAPIWDSAIGQNWLDNRICAEKFHINWFSILATGQSYFHPATLEATFIEYLEPSFCRQKKFVYGHKLSRLRLK